MDGLNCDKHARYFSLCLMMLPTKAQSEDANHMGIVYFCLQGLSLIKRMDVVDKNRDAYINYVYSQLQETEDLQWFSTSSTFIGSGNYDMPNLSSTYFALASLLALKEDYTKRIKPDKVMRFVRQLQMKSGPFAGLFQTVLDPRIGSGFGDTDLRYCYLALCIRRLVKWEKLGINKEDIDVELLQSFILRKVSYNGGLSSVDSTEPHAGLTFCGIAALSLLGYDFNSASWTQRTINWLVKRQSDYPSCLYNEPDNEGVFGYEYYTEEDVGGFNGRENKFSDTCYAWWVTGSLSLISPTIGVSLINMDQAMSYLIQGTQNKIMGGFGKDPDLQPDPFHSFLGLASLSLWMLKDSSSILDAIDSQLVISKSSLEFFNTTLSGPAHTVP